MDEKEDVQEKNKEQPTITLTGLENHYGKISAFEKSLGIVQKKV